MTSPVSKQPPRNDQCVVSVLVEVPPDEAFRVFSEEIDAWWRRGLRYRLGRQRSVVHLEPKLGGRLFESFESKTGNRIVETGRVTLWQPAERLVLEWRAVNFAPSERTEVEVVFQPTKSGTLVTVTHRGWSRLPDDHPVRHGKEAASFMRQMGLWWGGLAGALREHILAAHSSKAE
ncbi:MAG TPA: SRPBCC domain-containing protein [Polyangiaceae bacterium]|nr:SRPBCC domain-containing protein [Polyangiaceae bacterium]